MGVSSFVLACKDYGNKANTHTVNEQIYYMYMYTLFIQWEHLMTKVLCVTLKWGTRTDHVQILRFSKHQTNSFITFVSLLCGNEVWVDLFLNSKVILHKKSEKRVSVGIVGIMWWQYDWHNCFIIMRHICCNIDFLSFILNPKVLLDQQMLGFAFTGKCLVLNNLHCWSGLWQHFSELVYCSCAQGHFHFTMNVQIIMNMTAF